jgi:hypothetical protein
MQDRALAPARTALGEEAYAALFAEGARTPPGDAVARRPRTVLAAR